VKEKNSKMNNERIEVINNIKEALMLGDSFRKVEIGDPVITPEDRKRVILPFDCQRKRFINKIKRNIAVLIANTVTSRLNRNTEIEGLENALSVKGGAIVTCNHFNPIDSTVVRHLLKKCGRERGFNIVVQERNIFMKGIFGFLMRNCNTLPVSESPSYMAKNLKPAMGKILNEGKTVLIYPEQEMWFNYKRPRDMRIGAYYYAKEFGVPIIPCFVEMRETDGTDRDGFKNIKHIIHVLPPIYPEREGDTRAIYMYMKETDMMAKRSCYEAVYGVSPDLPFDAARDIAGYSENE
jgi:1-acyl-sn-glycerol-3-phosphate acyltransferase